MSTSRSSPGRAAYVDGRGGSSMRLNFSGVSEAEIHEGIRRIGEIVREQVALYGTLTGAAPRHRPGRTPAGTPGPQPLRARSSSPRCCDCQRSASAPDDRASPSSRAAARSNARCR